MQTEATELRTTAEAMLRHADYADYEGEAYVPIDAYRDVQLDRALAEQALVETLMEVEALAQRKRECKMWRVCFAGLAACVVLAKMWGFI